MEKKKSLGQHFLTSPKIILDIARAGEIKKSDTILEVGPGQGVLTSVILESGAHVISIEKDDRLIPLLQDTFSKEIASGQLKLVHDDILNVNLSNIVKGDYKVIANIPYYITGQIIRLFLEAKKQPKSMTLLLQKEVAKRIMAKNGKESLLSLSVKVYGEPKYMRDVGRGAFSPQPNVDSSVLKIDNISKNKFKNIEPEFFFKIIHAGFAHKRKQLLPNLSSLYDRVILQKTFEKLGLSSNIRAEDISVEKWLQICSNLKQSK